jgi:hypothetical protein
MMAPPRENSVDVKDSAPLLLEPVDPLPRTVSSQINPARRFYQYPRKNHDLDKSHVTETVKVDKSIDEGGNKKINQYIIRKPLGRYEYMLLTREIF